MSIINITDQSFQSDVLESDKLVLVDFWADWCGPCLRLHPILEEVAKERPDIIIAKLDVVKNPETTQKYDIKGLPSLLLFKQGKLIARRMAALPKADILDFLQTEAQ